MRCGSLTRFEPAFLKIVHLAPVLNQKVCEVFAGLFQWYEEGS